MMELKELGLQDFKIDMARQTYKTFYAKSGDMGTRGLRVFIYNNGEVFDCTDTTLTMYARPKDQEDYEVDATLVDGLEGEYEIIYPTNILQAGLIDADLKLRKDGKRISTINFGIVVDEGIMSDDAIEGNNKLPLLEQILDDEVKRKEAELLREEGEDNRNIDYGVAETARDGLYEDAEIARGGLYDDAEVARNNLYTGQESNRNTSYDTAEGTRNNSYSQAEENRDGEYGQAETVRDRLYDLAEEGRNDLYGEAEDDRNDLYSAAEVGRSQQLDDLESDLATHKEDYATQVGNVATLNTLSKQVVSAINELNTNKASKESPKWIYPTLLNGWIGPTLKYWKDSAGIVRFEGDVRSGLIGSIVFKMPEGYQTETYNRYISLAADQMAQIRFFQNGEVIYQAGPQSPTWLQFSGISFKAKEV